jgi:hypothetical protein
VIRRGESRPLVGTEIFLIKDTLTDVKYEEAEHYQVMRNFINNPGKMLEILLEISKNRIREEGYGSLITMR